VNKNGENIAVIASESDDFKRYVFDNLNSGYSYTHIRTLKDISGKSFNRCVVLGVCQLSLVDAVEKRII